MKTNLIFSLCVFLIVTASCKKDDLESDVPECISQKVDSFSKSDEGCSGASVWKYFHVDGYIYLFTPGDCENDKYIKMYDSDCNLVCYWKLEEFDANCSMSPEVFYRRDDGVLIWESK
jgi:hypothetical protein